MTDSIYGGSQIDGKILKLDILAPQLKKKELGGPDSQKN